MPVFASLEVAVDIAHYLQQRPSGNSPAVSPFPSHWKPTPKLICWHQIWCTLPNSTLLRLLHTPPPRVCYLHREKTGWSCSIPRCNPSQILFLPLACPHLSFLLSHQFLCNAQFSLRLVFQSQHMPYVVFTKTFLLWKALGVTLKGLWTGYSWSSASPFNRTIWVAEPHESPTCTS